ncbi:MULTISPECIES: hypothetical protein [Gordonia]|uniref:hypothetical protein n=1 Tax=Gordonia TaxID=2053 RepID=UPI001988D177|nr:MULTISPECIES: hypothetical protein [Gordonia]MBD0020690.1 hypothetical protein [Gordonia sp. (in: high G+C Gram-positive bacteria)]
MYAAIGTTPAVVIRLTPITLAVLLLWFGPIENVIGEDLDWARRWFPGRRLPDGPGRTAIVTDENARRRRRDTAVADVENSSA